MKDTNTTTGKILVNSCGCEIGGDLTQEDIDGLIKAGWTIKETSEVSE